MQYLGENIEYGSFDRSRNVLVLKTKTETYKFHKHGEVWYCLPFMNYVHDVEVLNRIKVYCTFHGGPYPTAHEE